MGRRRPWTPATSGWRKGWVQERQALRRHPCPSVSRAASEPHAIPSRPTPCSQLATFFDVPRHAAEGAVRAARADVGALLDGGARDALAWVERGPALVAVDAGVREAMEGGKGGAAAAGADRQTALLFHSQAAADAPRALVVLRLAPAPIPSSSLDTSVALLELASPADAGGLLPALHAAVATMLPATAAGEDEVAVQVGGGGWKRRGGRGRGQRPTPPPIFQLSSKRLADALAPPAAPTASSATLLLPLPDASLLSSIDTRPLSLARLAAAGAAAAGAHAGLDHVRQWAQAWVKTVTTALAEAPPTGQAGSGWPASEAAWWRARGAALATAATAASTPDAQTAMSILAAMAPAERARLGTALADAAGGAAAAAAAAACVATLDRSLASALADLEAAGTAADVENEAPPANATAGASLAALAARAAAAEPALGALAGDVATLLSLSRYHASPGRAAALVGGVCGRLTRVAAAAAAAAGPLWDAPAPAASAALAALAHAADALCDALRKKLLAKAGKGDKAAPAPSPPLSHSPSLSPAAVDDALAPGRRFAARVRALADLVEAGAQFASLGQVRREKREGRCRPAAPLSAPPPLNPLFSAHQLSYMPNFLTIAASASSLIASVRARCGGPLTALDADARGVDRDFLEAAAAVHTLEGQVLAAVDAALAAAPSTVAAASALAAANGAARGARLKAGLRARLPTLLARYAADMDALKTEFEGGRADPRPPPGVPRGAGGVLWARGLLQRVEAPMKRSETEGGGLFGGPGAAPATPHRPSFPPPVLASRPTARWSRPRPRPAARSPPTTGSPPPSCSGRRRGRRPAGQRPTPRSRGWPRR